MVWYYLSIAVFVYFVGNFIYKTILNYINSIVENQAEKFCEIHQLADDHGWKHFKDVRNHMINALIEYPGMSLYEKLCHKWAALLHDADDHKLFPNSKNFENARAILRNSRIPLVMINDVIYKISLVSASKNGNSTPKNKLDLLARECDRIEAIGEIGLVRCYIYTVDKNRQYFDKDTLLITNGNEFNLRKSELENRFKKYIIEKGEGSETMIDHFYDKLLHIGNLQTGNQYLNKLANIRMQIMKDWLYEVNTIRSCNSTDVTNKYIDDWAKKVVPNHYHAKKDSPVHKTLIKITSNSY